MKIKVYFLKFPIIIVLFICCVSSLINTISSRYGTFDKIIIKHYWKVILRKNYIVRHAEDIN